MAQPQTKNGTLVPLKLVKMNPWSVENEKTWGGTPCGKVVGKSEDENKYLTWQGRSSLYTARREEFLVKEDRMLSSKDVELSKEEKGVVVEGEMGDVNGSDSQTQ